MLHVVLLLVNAAVHAPCGDEPGHFGAGISHWHFGTFELYRVNPPLVRMVATLPAFAANCRPDWSAHFDVVGGRPEFDVGADIASANPETFLWYFFGARCAVIPFSLLGAHYCWKWAGELYGASAGLLAAVLWCFSPMTLGFGATIHPDVAAAALGVYSGYQFQRWLILPEWKRALSAGVALGLTELTKTTWIVLFGLWPFLAILTFFLHGRPRDRRYLVGIGPILLAGLFLLNLGYGFQGTFTPLRAYSFSSEAVQDMAARTLAVVGDLPIPAPREYVRGIDVQRKDFEGGFESYLRGEWSETGWWYFYLYALAIKVPLAAWVLAALSITCCRLRSVWRNELGVWLPGVVIFVLVSSQTGFTHYLRYVFPCFPFAYIWMSRVTRIPSWRFPFRRVFAVVRAVAIVWYVAASLFVFPHSMSYFNELIRGPTHGHRHLLFSNVDAGHDLLFLRRWLAAYQDDSEHLQLAYYGPIDPLLYGISYSLPRHSAPTPGLHAVSVSYLEGVKYWIPTGDGRSLRLHSRCFEYFQHFTPIARIGYSINIYRISLAEANEFRERYDLPLYR